MVQLYSRKLIIVLHKQKYKILHSVYSSKFYSEIIYHIFSFEAIDKSIPREYASMYHQYPNSFCSKLTLETLEQGVKYVQSQQ